MNDNPNINVVINNTAGTSVTVDRWEIKEESPRVDVSIGGMMYSLVLHPNKNPEMEVWSRDFNGPVSHLRTYFIK